MLNSASSISFLVCTIFSAYSVGSLLHSAINIGVGTALKGMNFLNTSTNTIRTKYQSMSTRRLIVLLREEVKERRLKNEAGESTKETVSRHIITPDLSASEKKQKIELAKSFTQLGEYKTAQDLLKSIN